MNTSQSQAADFMEPSISEQSTPWRMFFTLAEGLRVIVNGDGDIISQTISTQKNDEISSILEDSKVKKKILAGSRYHANNIYPYLYQKNLRIKHRRTTYKCAILWDVRNNIRLIEFTVMQQNNRRQANAEMRKLQELNDFKTTILNIAAHELNTPITPVRLQLHMLKEQLKVIPESKDAQKSVLILERNIERLSEIINDFLDVARIENDTLSIEFGHYKIKDIIEPIIESFRLPSERLGVILTHQEIPDIEICVDSKRLEQIVYNLISNAIKFTNKGGKVILYVVQLKEHIEIKIKDHGLGMEPNAMKNLFKPFSQIHQERQKYGGTGLGLFISNTIAQQHNGSINATSPGIGHGSEFTLRLPLTCHHEEPLENISLKESLIGAPGDIESNIQARLRELM